MVELFLKGLKIDYLEEIPLKGSFSSAYYQIIFIHGSGGNASIWKKTMEIIAQAGWGSIAISLPGHGASEGEGMANIPEYREFVNDFIEAKGLRNIFLAGHSLGGGIVLDFALKYPEKLKGIILIGTGARLRVHPQALEMFRQMAEGEIESKFEPWAFAEHTPAHILAEGEKEWSMTSPKVRYMDLKACDQFDIMEEVEKIRLPALIVVGTKDRLTPIKYAEYLHKKMKEAKLEIIPEVGHMLMLEAPEPLSLAIINFLKAF